MSSLKHLDSCLGVPVREGDQDGGLSPITCQPWDRARTLIIVSNLREPVG